MNEQRGSPTFLKSFGCLISGLIFLIVFGPYLFTEGFEAGDAALLKIPTLIVRDAILLPARLLGIIRPEQYGSARFGRVMLYSVLLEALVISGTWLIVLYLRRRNKPRIEKSVRPPIDDWVDEHLDKS